MAGSPGRGRAAGPHGPRRCSRSCCGDHDQGEAMARQVRTTKRGGVGAVRRPARHAAVRCSPGSAVPVGSRTRGTRAMPELVALGHSAENGELRLFCRSAPSISSSQEACATDSREPRSLRAIQCRAGSLCAEPARRFRRRVISADRRPARGRLRIPTQVLSSDSASVTDSISSASSFSADCRSFPFGGCDVPSLHRPRRDQLWRSRLSAASRSRTGRDVDFRAQRCGEVALRVLLSGLPRFSSYSLFE